MYFSICPSYVLPNRHIFVVGDVGTCPKEGTFSDAVRKASSLLSSLTSIFLHH